MQSGIGPADHLRAIGVSVIHDLPGVGSNLQDHLDLFVIAECTGDHTYDKYSKPHHAAWAGLQYLLLRKGPVASSLFETLLVCGAKREKRNPTSSFTSASARVNRNVVRLSH
jgi:choline dehydrogenase-like flavoprotein